MNTATLDSFLESQDLPGIVALATDTSETFYCGSAGVSTDASFAIMSMTKPITSFAILQLQEQGKLNIDDPACKYLASFKDHRVIADVDTKTGTYSEVSQNHDFTIRELLAHTAGFGYKFCNDMLGVLDPKSELSFPLLHQPGERWTYGVSTSLLGSIVEEVTGKRLADALDDMIFKPLGMSETSYAVREDQVAPHRWIDGGWQAQPHFPEMPYGDAGLISTAEDYARFLRCLLQRGSPLLSETTFETMTSNQIGNLYVETLPATNPDFTCPFPTGGGVDKWGLGFQLHMGPEEGMRSVGSFSWCGLLNTYFWVDPVKQIAGVVMMQLLPLYEPRCLDAVNGFERLLYQEIQQPSGET